MFIGHYIGSSIGSSKSKSIIGLAPFAISGVLLATGLWIAPLRAQQSNAKAVPPAAKSASPIPASQTTLPAAAPPAPLQTAATESSFAEALKAPVTLAVQGQTVEDVVRGLNAEVLRGSNAEGRPHLEAKNGAQWERVSIYGKEQPISRVMQGLHLLYNYPWIASTLPPAGSRQTFMATPRAREYEQSLWNTTLLRGAAPLFKLVEYLQTPAEEYQRQKKELEAAHKKPDDPLLHENLGGLSDSSSRLRLELLTMLTREQTLSLFEEGYYMLTPNANNPRQQQIAQVLGYSAGRVNALLGKAIEGETPEDSAAVAARFGLVLNVTTDPVTNAVTSYAAGISRGYWGTAQFSDIPKPADVLPVRGRPYNVNPEGRFLKPTYPELAQQRFPAALTLDNDTDLTWREVMEQLAKHLKQPLFSDDYSFTYSPKARGGSPLPKLAKLSLSEGLDALCSHYRYLWWYEDGMLFFRSRTWFVEKQYEVPPPVLALLQQHLQTKGKLDVACLDALSTLTIRQLKGLNMLRAGKIGEKNLFIISDYPIFANYARSYLQFWILLDAEQKEKVLSPEGLSFAFMSRSQQEAYIERLYVDRGPEIRTQLPDIFMLAIQGNWPLTSSQPGQKPEAKMQERLGSIRFLYKSRNDGLSVIYIPFTVSQSEGKQKSEALKP